MPDGTRAVDAPPSRPGAPFGIPGFLAPQSIGEVKELARMIALADWAPRHTQHLGRWRTRRH